MTVDRNAVALTATEHELPRVLGQDARALARTGCASSCGTSGASSATMRPAPGHAFSERGAGYRMPDPGEERTPLRRPGTPPMRVRLRSSRNPMPPRVSFTNTVPNTSYSNSLAGPLKIVLRCQFKYFSLGK